MPFIILEVLRSKNIVPKAYATDNIELRVLYREGDKSSGMAFRICETGM
jgi:hypothetical protein